MALKPEQKRTFERGAIIVSLLFLWWFNGHVGLPAKQNQTCDAVNTENAAILSYINQQLNRSQKALPSIGYYRDHPVELGKALVQLNQQRKAAAESFGSVSC